MPLGPPGWNEQVAEAKARAVAAEARVTALEREIQRMRALMPRLILDAGRKARAQAQAYKDEAYALAVLAGVQQDLSDGEST